MSGAVYERVEYAGTGDRRQAAPHQRLVLAAVVVATLSMIAWPLLGAVLGLGGRLGGLTTDEALLTPTARRVLDELPGAYTVGGMVVVPDMSASGSEWANAVPPDLVDGAMVDLGVRGLAAPSYLPSRGAAPSWLSEVGTGDKVFKDVGNLSFACTRWPGAERCTGSLLVEHGDEHFYYQSGLSLVDSPEQVRTLRVLDLGVPTNLVMGVLPQGATFAAAAVDGESGPRQLPVNVSAPGAVGGATLWWVSARSPVESVMFLDDHDRVLGRVTPGA